MSKCYDQYMYVYDLMGILDNSVTHDVHNEQARRAIDNIQNKNRKYLLKTDPK